MNALPTPQSQIESLQRALADTTSDLERAHRDVGNAIEDYNTEKARADAASSYAVLMADLLRECREIAHVFNGGHNRALVNRIDAALAKTPNPSGQRTAKPSESLPAEDSGPVGLGPVIDAGLACAREVAEMPDEPLTVLMRAALKAVADAFAYAPGRGPEWYELVRAALAGRCRCDDALGESCSLCHPLGGEAFPGIARTVDVPGEKK